MPMSTRVDEFSMDATMLRTRNGLNMIWIPTPTAHAAFLNLVVKVPILFYLAIGQLKT